MFINEAELYVDNWDLYNGYFIYADNDYLGYVDAFDEETFYILLDGITESVTLKASYTAGGSAIYSVTATLEGGERYTWTLD